MTLLSQVSTSYPRVPRDSFARTRAHFLTYYSDMDSLYCQHPSCLFTDIDRCISISVHLISTRAYAMFNSFSLPGFRCIDGLLQLVRLLPSKGRNSDSRMLLSKVFPGFPDTLFSAACCWHFYMH